MGCAPSLHVAFVNSRSKTDTYPSGPMSGRARAGLLPSRFERVAGIDAYPQCVLQADSTLGAAIRKPPQVREWWSGWPSVRRARTG